MLKVSPARTLGAVAAVAAAPVLPACNAVLGVGVPAAAPGAVATAAAAGCGWLCFCQFSHSMKLENVKIITSIRRRVSMYGLRESS